MPFRLRPPVLVPAFVMVAAAVPVRAACPPPSTEAVTGLDVRADGTIRLSDGRELRLAGVELSEEGRTQLAVLTKNAPLTIHPVAGPDRWGRVPAHIDVVEEALVAKGLGHAAAQVPGACLGPLLDAEAKARTARAGIWASEGYALAAADGEALTRRLGRPVIAEGRVVSARTVRGRVYLNFARYWKSGLSLIIAEKDWPLFSSGAEAESFVGRRLRARGRLEWRHGPVIVAGPADRIEVLGL